MNKPTFVAKESTSKQGAEVSFTGTHAYDDGVSEEELSAALRSKNRLLTFPSKLEKLYLDQHIPRAIRRFHVLLPIIMFLYAIIVSGITGFIPKQSFTLWLTIVVSVTITLLLIMALSFFSIFNRWFHSYGVCGGTMVIAATIIITNLFPLGQNSPLLYASIIFAILIMYTCIGMTFVWGLCANLLGGLSAVVIMSSFHILVNWSLSNRLYICSSILGLGLCYALESQERKNFLNTYLLRLTVRKGKNLAKQLEVLSKQDPMTGLANRRHLDEVLNTEVKRALRQYDPLTIMIIDVDYFKAYNDTQGHLAGDECLRKIAKLLLQMTKRSGELAARYGGEEFVLVYPMMDTSIAKQQAIRLLECMAALALPHPNGNLVTFSIGVTVYEPAEGTAIQMDVEQLLRQADTALYMAKKNGRNRYAFFSETNGITNELKK